MLFKSGLVTQISGSFGGLTGSHNRGGLYLRARAIPTDPNTPDQVVVRNALGLLNQRWIDDLTPLERASWNTYAANVPLTGPLGDPITVSGLNMYIRSNVPRIQLITTIIDQAPAIFDTGTLSPVSITNISEATQQFDVTFTDADGWNVANGHLVLQQSRPLNTTINFFRGPYRHAGSVNGVAVSPVTKPTEFSFVAGQRMFFRVRATYADGRLTQPQFIGPFATVA